MAQYPISLHYARFLSDDHVFCSTALDTLDFLQLVAMNKLIESKRKPDAVIPRARQSSIVSGEFFANISTARMMKSLRL